MRAVECQERGPAELSTNDQPGGLEDADVALVIAWQREADILREPADRNRVRSELEDHGTTVPVGEGGELAVKVIRHVALLNSSPIGEP